MNLFRWMLGLPLAAAITLGLFVVMSGLIAQPPRTVTPKDPPKLEFLAKLKTSTIDPTVRPPKPPENTPEPPPDRWVEPVSPGKGGVIPTPGPTRVEPTIPTMGGDGAIVTVAPQYPENCRARGAEGVVLVRYDVSERGEVTNVQIISSDNHCFDRTVIKAVMSWKYSPKARRGIVQRFVFSLNDE